MKKDNSVLISQPFAKPEEIASNLSYSVPQDIIEMNNKRFIMNLALFYSILGSGLLFIFLMNPTTLPFTLPVFSIAFAALCFSFLYIPLLSVISTIWSGRIFLMTVTLVLSEFELPGPMLHPTGYAIKLGLLLVAYLCMTGFWRTYWKPDAVIAWILLLYYCIRSGDFKAEAASSGVLPIVIGIHYTVTLIYNHKYGHKITAKYLSYNKSDDLWRALNDASADGIIIFNLDRIYYVNNTALCIFNKSASELLEKPIAVLAPDLACLEFEAKEESKCVQFPDKYHKDLYELILHYIASPAELGVQRICMTDGQRVFSIFCSSFLAVNEKHYLLSIRDITQMKEIECSRAKTVLLSSLSHELKTPLNAVIDTLKWFIQSMDDITKEGLKIAYTSSQLLHNYVSNVLDYADYTNGWKLSVKPMKTDVRKVVKKTRQLYKKQIKVCKAAFSALVEKDVPLFLRIDKKRLSQVLINTLGVCLRYTYQGGVFMRISYDFPSTLKIVVEDTGAGIPFSTDSEKLFSMVREGDPTFCDSGIHLATTQIIVRALGGTMEIQTHPDKGTSMAISVPATTAENLSRTPARRKAKVEKYKSNSIAGKDERMLLGKGQIELGKLMKESEPYNYNPKDIEEFPCKPPDPTLFSPRVFPLTKLAINERLDSEPREKSPTFETSARKVPKESDSGKLPESIAVEEPQKVHNKQACNCSSVLIVDDNALNLYVIESILKRQGLKCDKASNGRDAINMVMSSTKCPVCKGYDITFMDCNMPIMNGFEAAAKMRELMGKGVIKSMPIIANSAFNEGDCLPKCEEVGINAFCTFLLNVTEHSTKAVNH